MNPKRESPPTPSKRDQSARNAAIKRVQDLARETVPEGISLVEDLLEQRRREAGVERVARDELAKGKST